LCRAVRVVELRSMQAHVLSLRLLVSLLVALLCQNPISISN